MSPESAAFTNAEAAAAAAAAAALRPLRPEAIRVLPLAEVLRAGGEEAEQARGFVMNIRSAAPYLQMHAGKVMVVHISSSLLGTEDFDGLMGDLALVKMLGVRLVLVASVRQQVDERLLQQGKEVLYCGDYRVTDAETLRVVKEVTGAARAEVEASLSRSSASSHLSAGGGQMSMGGGGVSVISGNLFYTSQPMGVRGGVDFGFSGEVRRVDAAAMHRRLANGDVVLLTSLG